MELIPYRDIMYIDTRFWNSYKEREAKTSPTDSTLYQQFHIYDSSICNQNSPFMSAKQLQDKNY